MLNKIKNFMINAAVWTGAITVAFMIIDEIYQNTAVLDWLMYLPTVPCVFVKFFMMMAMASGMLYGIIAVMTKVTIRRNRKYFTVAK